MLVFRPLRADEIECRVGMVRENGLSLLLYKDARVDQKLLDEHPQIGPLNWQRSHSRENANCVVSIWDENKKQWISKEDTGTESNTEKEKGIASDSFKRACVNWGIGRELYTAPFIWVDRENCNIEKGRSGKWECKDEFIVERIQYSESAPSLYDVNITGLAIRNNKLNVNAFEWANGKTIKCGNCVSSRRQQPQQQAPQQQPPQQQQQQQQKPKTTPKIDDTKARMLVDLCMKDGVDIRAVLAMYNVQRVADLTEKKFQNIHEHWEDVKAAILKQ